MRLSPLIIMKPTSLASIAALTAAGGLVAATRKKLGVGL
jgi:hypothetical protein